MAGGGGGTPGGGKRRAETHRSRTPAAGPPRTAVSTMPDGGGERLGEVLPTPVTFGQNAIPYDGERPAETLPTPGTCRQHTLPKVCCEHLAKTPPAPAVCRRPADGGGQLTDTPPARTPTAPPPQAAVNTVPDGGGEHLAR